MIGQETLRTEGRRRMISLLRGRSQLLSSPENKSPETHEIAPAASTLGSVPAHPGYIMPSPTDLWEAYQEALVEIERNRRTQLREDKYAREARHCAFSAFVRALSNSCSAIVAHAHPNGWGRNHPQLEVPEVQAVASGPGSGKSTAAKAFAVTLARTSEANGFPLGCVLLVHHVHTANVARKELAELLGEGQVAVFTAENDAERGAIRNPAFRVDELKDYPVLVTTHEFYKQIRGHKARMFTRAGLTLPRVLTFIDEKVEEIQTFDTTMKIVEEVCEFVQRHEEWNEALLFAVKELQGFVMQKRYDDLAWETPAHDPEGWGAAQRTQWFTTDEAGRYMRFQGTNGADDRFKNVFGFGRSLAEGRAFIQRRNGGNRGTHFVGYERAVPQVTGMVLLDASADIDGSGDLCPWRKLAQSPLERYDRLDVVHVQSIADRSLARWLQDAAHRELYAQHILDVVQRQVEPGQKALIVCKKALVEAKGIRNWSEHMAQFSMSARERMRQQGTTGDDLSTAFPWAYEGRQLGLTWYGGYGIGANDWRDADVVLLFDYHHLPKRVVIATAQGLMGHNATEGILSPTQHDKTAHPHVKALSTGHVLRWLKQMALRGKARQFDHNGVCAKQKLVITGDIVMLVENFDDLFPGAMLRHEPTALDHEAEHLSKLAYALMTPRLKDTVSASRIAELMGVEWRNVSSDLRRDRSWPGLLRGLRWEYVSRPGRAGSFFQRTNNHEERT